MRESTHRPVVVIASETLGHGDDELGAILMRSFLKTLATIEPQPYALVFQNGGVKHVVDGAPLLEDVRALASAGVHVLSCGTCLDFFGLKDALAVGDVSNMHDILSLLLAAPNVIRP